MADRFRNTEVGLGDPARHCFDISPSDSVDLTDIPRAIYTGSGGTIKVTMDGGETVTFENVPAGADKGWRVKRVWSTGTTATGLKGFY